MCGINGFLAEDESLIKTMNEKIAHRGPDARGVFVANGISLGHTRLSILDTSASANQPMFSDPERFVIIFNGEIYNFEDLKQELSSYNFKTTSDTEMLLAGFQEWGTDLFAKLNGIFALAIFDTKTETLYLARDKMGVKPLYYYNESNQFIFSSEIKALLEADIPRKLNMNAFDAYMRLLFVPGNETMFQDIHRVPPGSYMVIKKDEAIRSERFVTPSSATTKRTSVSKKDVENTIDTAVTRQLISDRPLGLYLSGGIDSSIILDAVSKQRANVTTFSIGFDLEESEERAKFNKDFDLAATTAKRYGATHTGFLIEKHEVLPALQNAIRHMDEPVSNPTMIPMILLAERVKAQGIDVVLGGDGADELFGGYMRYRWAFIRDVYRTITIHPLRAMLEKLHPIFKKLNDATSVDQYGRFMFQKESTVQEVQGNGYRNGEQFKKVFTETYLSAPVTAKQSMEVDTTTWLVNESLLRSDKLSMAHGLELRVPFLDNTVVDLASNIPVYKKVGLFSTKKILKQAFRKRLPEYLFKQPKRGWFSPGAKWLRDPEIKAFAEEVFSEDFHPETNALFDLTAVRVMLDEHVNGTRYNATMLWAVLVFRVWAEEYGVKIK